MWYQQAVAELHQPQDLLARLRTLSALQRALQANQVKHNSSLVSPPNMDLQESLPPELLQRLAALVPNYRSISLRALIDCILAALQRDTSTLQSIQVIRALQEYTAQKQAPFSSKMYGLLCNAESGRASLRCLQQIFLRKGVHVGSTLPDIMVLLAKQCKSTEVCVFVVTSNLLVFLPHCCTRNFTRCAGGIRIFCEFLA